ncbi:hypothetical protein GCM10009663_67170 [Kitasatospora arboriphila]|uniref:Uncharacterized protein n=1 Tax=Kitasatospora arboriphila TaxID=258052 RepID=A0ABN1U6L5_9ACTN
MVGSGARGGSAPTRHPYALTTRIGARRRRQGGARQPGRGQGYGETGAAGDCGAEEAPPADLLDEPAPAEE